MTTDMRIFQTVRFERQVKKLHSAQKKQLDTTVREILANPQIGDLKKGDLSGAYVFKFKIQKQQYLLAYTVATDALTFLMLGPHENFYRDLKK